MAGTRCTVCDHPELKSINLALATQSERSIAKRFTLGNIAVHRHKATHLKPALVRAIVSREGLNAAALVDKLIGYMDEAEQGIKIAKSTKDLAGLARCIKEARETAVYIGKTIGLWGDARTQTVIDNRTQTLNIAELSVDELRALARFAE